MPMASTTTNGEADTTKEGIAMVEQVTVEYRKRKKCKKCKKRNRIVKLFEAA